MAEIAGYMSSMASVAIAVPLLMPAAFLVGVGLEEKAFIAEVEEWCKEAGYVHTEEEAAAAKECVKRVFIGQVAGVGAGALAGYMLFGLRAIAIAVAALGGGQVGAVYPTVQTTAGLLSVPDSALSDQARRMLAVGAEGHHKSLRGRHETVLAAAPPPPA